MFTVRNEARAARTSTSTRSRCRRWARGRAANVSPSGQLQSEVRDFIENGSDNWASLSPEGAPARQRVNDATLGGSMPYGADQQAFLDSIAPMPSRPRLLGVAPELVAAHAALESGWGQHPLTRADGGSNHNLFGIKAGKGWQGEVSRALTTEHLDGRDVKRTESFRAYSGLQDAFADYAQLLAGNPRYRGALGVGSNAQAFAQGWPLRHRSRLCRQAAKGGGGDTGPQETLEELAAKERPLTLVAFTLALAGSGQVVIDDI